MTTYLSAHQSQFLPWPPYFRKVALSNVFVWMDAVQFQRGQASSVQHRNKLHTEKGEMWLSLALQKCALDTPIREVKLSHPAINNKKWDQLKQGYAKAPFWRVHCDPLHLLLCQHGYDTLDEMNFSVFSYLLNYLEIETPIIRLSSLGVSGHKTDLLVNMCHKLSATHYVSGLGARDYLNVSAFEQHKIQVLYLPSSPPVYDHSNAKSISGLSMLDMVLHVSKARIQKYLYEPCSVFTQDCL